MGPILGARGYLKPRLAACAPRRGANATAAPVAAEKVIEVATRTAVSIDEDAPLAKAAQLLLELGIHRLLVTRSGKLAGLLSSTDILKWVARPAIEAEPD